MRSLPNLDVFTRTYELGGFTRAAQAMGLTPQAASRAVGRLEVDLGVTLFRRTTRRLEPTEAGRAYYARCRQALDLIAQGERELSVASGSERGTVRISVPTTWGHHRFLPALARFRRDHPTIDVTVQIDNRAIDFVKDGYDFAIRMGTIRDQTLIARKLADCGIGVYASPEYLARSAAPRTLADLARHTCIGFVMPGSGRVLPWVFAHDEMIAPVVELRILGDVLGCITLAASGAGLVQTYDFLVERELARGALVEVLAAHRGGSRPFSLIYPRGVTQTPAARALASFLVSDAKSKRSH
jgi:DNA-binding transcriptional LysR family regulator